MLVDQTNLHLSKLSWPQPSPEVCRASFRWPCYVYLDILCAFQIVRNKTSIRNSLPYENNFHKTSINKFQNMCICTPNLAPNDNDSVGWAFESWNPGPSIKVKEMLLAEVAQEGQLRLVSFGWLFVFEKKNLRPTEFFYQSWWNAVDLCFMHIPFKRSFSLFLRKLEAGCKWTHLSGSKTTS